MRLSMPGTELTHNKLSRLQRILPVLQIRQQLHQLGLLRVIGLGLQFPIGAILPGLCCFDDGLGCQDRERLDELIAVLALVDVAEAGREHFHRLVIRFQHRCEMKNGTSKSLLLHIASFAKNCVPRFGQLCAILGMLAHHLLENFAKKLSLQFACVGCIDDMLVLQACYTQITCRVAILLLVSALFDAPLD